MARKYAAGTAKITIRPDLDGFKKALEEQVKAALATYDKDAQKVPVHAEIKLDFTEADTKLEAWLNKRRSIDVHVNAKTLDKIKGDLENIAPDIEIQPRVDTSKSSPASRVWEAEQKGAITRENIHARAEAAKTAAEARENAKTVGQAERQVDRAVNAEAKRLRAEAEKAQAASVQRDRAARYRAVLDRKAPAPADPMSSGDDWFRTEWGKVRTVTKAEEALRAELEKTAQKYDDYHNRIFSVDQSIARDARKLDTAKDRAANVFAKHGTNSDEGKAARASVDDKVEALRRSKITLAEAEGIFENLNTAMDKLHQRLSDAITIDRPSIERYTKQIRDLDTIRQSLSNVDQPIHLRQVVDQGKQLTSLPRGERTSRLDAAAIRDASSAARQYDSDLRTASDAMAEQVRATRALSEADLALSNLRRSGATDIVELSRAENALTEARLRSTRAEQDAKRADSLSSASKHVYDKSQERLDTRSSLGRGTLIKESFQGLGSGLMDKLKSELLTVSRVLTSVIRLAAIAAISVAALGAVSITPMIGSILKASQALAILPAAAAGAAAGIAALAVGGSGVVGAFKSITKESKDSGKESVKAAKDAAAAQKSQEQAARQVRDAQEGVGDAYRNAGRVALDNQRNIESAEKRVVSAQKDSLDAQKQLSRSREDAVDKIRNMNDALRGNALDERAAVLAVARARKSLAETLRDPKADGLDQEEAQLGVEQALRGLDEVRRRNREEQQQAAKANKAGIEGDEGVIRAKEGIVTATENVQQAQQGVQDAQTQAAQATEDSQRRIRDALEHQSDALQAQSEAWAKNTEERDAADIALEQSLAKLAPNARDFVERVRNMGASWTDLRKSVQDDLFAGTGAAVERLGAVQLPILKEGLKGVAGQLNGGILDSMDVFSTFSARTDFTTFFANTIRGFGGLRQAVAPLSQSFIDLSTVGSQFLPRFGEAIGRASQDFATKIADMRSSGDLSLMMQNGIDKAKQLGDIIGNVFGSIRQIFHATSGEGDSMMLSLQKGAQRMRDFLGSEEGQKRTQEFFSNARDTLHQLLQILSPIGQLFTGTIFPAFHDAGGIFLKVAGHILELTAGILNATPIVEHLLAGFLAYRAVTAVMGPINGLLRGLGVTAGVSKDQISSAGKALQGFTVTQGANGAIQVTATQVKTLGEKAESAGKRLSGAKDHVVNFGNSIRGGGVMSAMSNFKGLFLSFGVGAVIGGLSYVMSAMDSFKQKTKESAAAFDEFNRGTANFETDLKSNLSSSGGVTDANTIATLGARTDSYGAALQKKIDSRPGFTENVGSIFSNLFNGDEAGYTSKSFLGTRKTDEDRTASDDAAGSQKILDGLNMSSKDIGVKLGGRDDVFNGFIAGINPAQRGAKEFNEEMKKMRVEFLNARDSGRHAAEVLDTIKAGAMGAAEGTAALSDAWKKMDDDFFTTENAQEGLNKAIDDFVAGSKDYVDAQADMHGMIDTTTASGRALKDHLDEVRVAAQRAGAAASQEVQARGGSQQEAAQAAAAAVAQMEAPLRDQLSQLKGVQGNVDGVLAHYKLFPADIVTRIQADPNPATATVDRWIVDTQGKIVQIKINASFQGTLDRLPFDIGKDLAPIPVGMEPQTTQGIDAVTQGLQIAPVTPQQAPPNPLGTGPQIPAPAQPGVPGAPPPPPGSNPEAPAGAPPQVTTLAMVPDYSAAQRAFENYANAIKRAYDEMIAPSFDGATQKANFFGQSIVDMNGQVQPAIVELNLSIAGVDGFFKDHIENGAVVSWSKLKPVMGLDIFDIKNNMFPLLIQGLTDVGTKFAGFILSSSTTFDQIRGAIARPINWVIDNVFNGGLKNAWNSVRTVLPSLGEWTAAAPRIPGFSTGGHVRGAGGPTDDRIPAMLSNGEFVVKASTVKKVGVSNLERFNDDPVKAGGKALGEGMFAGPLKLANGGYVDKMIDRGKKFMQAESGKPYQYGGVGDPSWDCSGLISGLVHELMGQNARSGRLFNTESNFESMGWKPGAKGAMSIGIMRGGGGENSHMAGTLDGTNAESSGDHGVQWGGPARGADNPMFSLQYYLPEIMGAFKSGGMGSAGSGNYNTLVMKQIEDLFTKPVDGLRKSAPNFGPSLFSQIPTNAMNSVVDAASQAVAQAAPSLSSAVGGALYPISGGAERWRPNVIAALKREGYEVNDRNIELTLSQIQSESSGNPYAVQGGFVDANTGGNEAVGLLQVAKNTWPEVRNPQLPDDRTNPDASISAGLRYMRQKHGGDLGSMWGQGHGYDQGGMLKDGTFGWNMSGKPEPVLTGDQWKLIQELIDSVKAAKPGLDALASSAVPGNNGSASIPTSYQSAPATVDGFTPAPSTVSDLPSYTPPADPELEALRGKLAADQATYDNAKGDDKAKAKKALELSKHQLDEAESRQALAGAGSVPQTGGQSDVDKAQNKFDNAQQALNAAPPEEQENARKVADKAKADLDAARALQASRLPDGVTPYDQDPLGVPPPMSEPGAAPPSWMKDAPSPQDQGLIPGGDSLMEAQKATLNPFEQLPGKALSAVGKFFEANVDQFKSDIGYSGQGVLSQALDQAMKAANGEGPKAQDEYHFHVSDIDEALREFRKTQVQNALTFIKR